MEQVLAVRGVEGYRQYRDPALAVTPAGSAVVAYAGLGRQGRPPATGDLLLRRSFDGGATWEPQQVAWADTSGQAAGRPGLFSDAATGRIFLAFVAAAGGGDAGPDPAATVRRFELLSSDDDGASWQHRSVAPRRASDAITGLAAAGPGTGLHAGRYAGRLLVQFAVLADGARPGAASCYSDDHGDTWTMGEPLPARDPGPAAEDGGGAAACLADGRVLLHVWAAPRRWAAVSDDGGHSYGPLQPVDELSDSGSSGSLVRFDGLPAVGGLAAPASDRWLLAANCQDPLLRRNVVLSLSRDNGHSWPHKLTIYPSGASGPVAVRLPDGRIGVLYQRQGGREIVYATADPGLLLAAWPRGAVTARDDDDAAGPGPVTGPLPVPKDYPLRFDMVLHAVRSKAEGRPAPGYRAGDALVFAGRAKMLGPQHLRVRLSGGFDNAADFPPQDLGPGGEARYLHPVRTVTGTDVAAGGLTVSFTCTAAPPDQPSGGAPVASRTREFSIDVVSGEIRET